MNRLKTGLILAGAVFLTGCGQVWETAYDDGLSQEVTRGWNVRQVTVTVPEDVTTTERDVLAPNADIVWHEDPLGDRKAQTAAIVDAGITRGASGLRGGRSVNFAVSLLEFHAVSPAARSRAPSAVHNITYVIQVFDARTNAPLTEPQQIKADLEAYTGSAANQAVEQGATQKVRITNHLAATTAGWLGIGTDQRREFSIAGR